MKKILRLSIWVISCLIILFGLFVFVSTRDIPLPNNAKKEGDMIHIDIGEEATNETEKKEARFIVPERFTPEVFERGFAFNFKLPDGTPYTGNESPVPLDRVRVVVKHHAKIEAARSSYILRQTQPKDGPLFAAPWFVESKDGLEIYQYKINATAIGLYFKFDASDGSNILADDAGDWARAYEINRKLSPHIELNYLLSKKLVRDPKHFIEDVTAVDNAVLKLVQSFQSK
jgi:hypothetical protein